MSEQDPLALPEDWEDKFEIDGPFDEEPVNHTIGRLEWMSLRIKASLIVYLARCGFDERQIGMVLPFFDETESDYTEFIKAGLDYEETEDTAPELHPKSVELLTLVEQFHDQTQFTVFDFVVANAIDFDPEDLAALPNEANEAVNRLMSGENIGGILSVLEVQTMSDADLMDELLSITARFSDEVDRTQQRPGNIES